MKPDKVSLPTVAAACLMGAGVIFAASNAVCAAPHRVNPCNPCVAVTPYAPNTQ